MLLPCCCLLLQALIIDLQVNNHSRGEGINPRFCLKRLFSFREKDRANERELRRKERDLWSHHTESRLRDMHEREKIHLDMIEEKRRERVRASQNLQGRIPYRDIYLALVLSRLLLRSGEISTSSPPKNTEACSNQLKANSRSDKISVTVMKV